MRNIKWKPLLAMMTVVLVVVQTFLPSLSVLAQTTENKMYKVGQTQDGLVISSSYKPSSNLKASGTSSGKMSAWYGGYETSTAYIEVDGEPAFCIEPSKKYPVNMAYAQSVYNDEGIMNILYYGYPRNGTSEKNYVDTYVALNFYLGNFDSPAMANDSGVKYLLDKAKSKTAPLGDFGISNTNQSATWNASTKRQETKDYVTTYESNGSTNYQHFTLPSGLAAVTHDGKKHTGNVTLEASEDWKLVAGADYDGTVSFDVTTDVCKMSSLKFTPNDSNTQTLMKAGGVSDPFEVDNVTAKFEKQKGDGIIVKKDKRTGKTLSGAQYHVTGDDFDKTVTTGTDGKAPLNDLIVGNYQVVETKAPAGYTIDSTPKTLIIKAKETTTLDVNNQEAFFQVKLNKQDAETGNKAQGAATLDSAEYTLYDDKECTKPLETMTVQDNSALSKKYSFNNSTSRKVYLKETKAPTGYNLNNEVKEITATQDNQTQEVFIEDTTSKEDVIKGNIVLTKVQGLPDDGNYSGGALPTLEGAEFTFTSDTTGEVTHTATTDKNGRIELNEVIYDTYTVHESVTPEGFKPVPDFKITVDTQGKTYYYTLEDVAKCSDIKVVKKDATTGKVIPMAGAQFQIYDALGNLITQKINYPTPLELSTFETSSDGSFNTPYPLVAGNYFLKEVRAPAGYTLNEELIPFVVTGDESEVVVECEDTPQMGKIIIDKYGETVDAEKTDVNKLIYTDELLPNVEYDIVAKTDIITPDGTIRAKAGEVVDHVKTDKDGHAESKELYLGDYTLIEVKAPFGYVLGADKDVSLKYAWQEVKVTSASAELYNKLAKSDIVVTKKGSDGKLLKGVEFCLYDPNGQLIMTTTTNDKGQCTFKNVPANLKDYTVKETKTIDGYEMDAKAQTVSVKEDGKQINLEFTNSKIPTPVTPLPKTGDSSTDWLYLIAGTLIGATGMYLVKRKGTKNK
ncbi:SpaA isopeptide-forming pilin-related protein [Listeria ilorinensis]|uniref:SpaA isopeptide-forming pilin-related protein n=1 Tax=Listeria ilorinensis TaxID=2867439 RepID=UPI001EF700F4|nr:SpaA isopeptide-forming pilin-related protein [Listeria ilorinensis]